MVTYGTMRSKFSLTRSAPSKNSSPAPAGEYSHTRTHALTWSIWTACTHTEPPAKFKQMILVCSATCKLKGDPPSPPPPHTSTPPLHFCIHFLSPSLCSILCMCPVISPSAHNCPNLWCFFCSRQFRGSEILLSDCHNASASGKGCTAACLPHSPWLPPISPHYPSL